MKQADKFYLSAEWRALRLMALRRDGWRCQICGLSVAARGAARVDHINPRRDFPEMALLLSNVRSLCATCDNRRHREKGRPLGPRCGPDGWPIARGGQ